MSGPGGAGREEAAAGRPRISLARLARLGVLAVAFASLLALLCRLDPYKLLGFLRSVGWGMALILAQELVAHLFNALGWRFAFSAQDAAAFPYRELVKLRVAGDAVNYLTPSATIAGEFIRAVTLSGPRPAEVRYASVAVSKLTQAAGQALFIASGLAFLLVTGNPAAQRHGTLLWSSLAAIGAVLAAGAAAGVWARRRIRSGAVSGSAAGGPAWLAGGVPRQCAAYLAEHPGRFAISAAFFYLGFAWGAFEAFWICRFLGVPAVGVATALVIETLSCFLDGVLFMVPAKVGTQEAGKTAVFAALGMDAGAGFAFGVVRHVRELAWALGGLFICSRIPYFQDRAGSLVH